MADVDYTQNPLLGVAQAGLAEAETGRAQAQIPLLGQQTEAASLANQKAAAILPLIKAFAKEKAQDMSGQHADQSGVTPSGQPAASSAANPNPGTSADDSSVENVINPQALTAALRDRFFVNKAGSPQQQKNISDALTMDGLAGTSVGPAAIAERDNSVLAQTTANEKAANQLYEQAWQVTQAPQGSKLAALRGLDPKAHDAILARFKGDTEDAENAAAVYALHMGQLSHQYTGRKSSYNEAQQPIDDITKQPLVGVPQSGISPSQFTSILTEMNKPIPVQHSNGSTSLEPTWTRIPGAVSAETAALKIAHGFKPNIPGMPDFGISPAQPGTQRAAIANGHTAPAPGDAAHAHASAAAAPTMAQQVIAREPDPTLKSALSDPDFKYTGPGAAGQPVSPRSMTELEQTQAAAYKEQRPALQNQSAEQIRAGQMAKTYLSAAKQIMQSKEVPTVGPLGNIIASASALFPGEHVDASNYEQVVKLLSNAALGGIRQVIPTNRVTNNEVNLQLNKMSPSVQMVGPALGALVDKQLRFADYAIDSAGRATKYIAAGNDPGAFDVWNQKHFPADKIINAGEQAAKPSTKAMPTGAKLAAYAKAYFGGDETAARNHLSTQHGYK